MLPSAQMSAAIGGLGLTVKALRWFLARATAIRLMFTFGAGSLGLLMLGFADARQTHTSYLTISWGFGQAPIHRGIDWGKSTRM
jgi:hypothetical protein